MVTTCSPHRPPGGSLHLTLSPTHSHKLDTTAAAIRQLRRSLSSSPSHGPTFHLITSKSPSSSPRSPLSPSPRSPTKTNSEHSYFSLAMVGSASPLAIPFPPSAKIHRTSAARRSSPMRVPARSRISPTGTVRRPLGQSRDGGNANAGSPSSTSSMSSSEDNFARNGSSVDKPFSHRSSRKTSDILPDETLPVSGLLTPGRALSRSDRMKLASPLKRSDGGVGVDRASSGSPNAKRRSLHGGTFGNDFNIFEHGPSSTEQEAARCDASSESKIDASEGSSLGGGHSPFFASMPKRSSSLRKSTLQQRHSEKPTFARARPNPDLASEFSNPGLAVGRGRGHRMSLENFLAPMPRDSPFSAQGALPNASLHVLGQVPAPHQPHPLSYTMTQSSSGSSLGEDLADDSPTHAPAHSNMPRSVLDFSKSLPMGVTRPARGGHSSHESSSRSSFSTPHNYKLVKPLPAAFMSTGLISKKNRNAEETGFGGNSRHAQMPDTPCKRSTTIFGASQAPFHTSPFGAVREVRHEFGTPSTPLNPHPTRPVPGTFGKGVSVFGSGYGVAGLFRRGSFVGVELDEGARSPSLKGDSQSSEYDLPPTPTKPIGSLGRLRRPRARSESQDYPVMDATFPCLPDTRCVTALGIHSSQEESTCKSPSTVVTLTPRRSSPGPEGPNHAEGVIASSPTLLGSRLLSSLARRPMSPIFPFSPTTARSRRMSQIARSKKLLISPGLPNTRTFKVAKSSSRLSPASPSQRFDSVSDRGPHTPKDHVIPPDPSGLSISGHDAGDRVVSHRTSRRSSLMLPPATPTAVRETFQSHHRRSSITPISGFTNIDVDPSLSSRFEQVELIGTGEFSAVYRVTEPVRSSALSPTSPFYELQSPSARSSLQTLVSDRVFAVKKSRHAYAGTRDRQRKLHEVHVLQSLGRSDHTIHFINSWEEKNHLYIQTEFCEEGSLEMFLAQVGIKARLDDFRIWKVMLELSLGLKHIHDAGFIHLDLKPANILITFEGVLKIADFGMANRWPAPPGIEGEGDREYIGPEILMGNFDKPADIFALGLIMLEIAGNVELPDNGPSWQKLRTGDMSDVPSLTSISTSTVSRDSSGNPIARVESAETVYTFDLGDEDDRCESPTTMMRVTRGTLRHQPGQPQASDGLSSKYDGITSRRGELLHPPSFMTDPQNEQALDRVVRWMISPLPLDRPVVDQILSTEGVRWADQRRRAGATIFEGNWGPADEVLDSDLEMTDA